MPRPPKIRVSYNEDAQYFLRLVNALERDRARPQPWRKKMIGKLQDLASDFLNAPARSEDRKGKEA